jgi:hypothetical protein
VAPKQDYKDRNNRIYPLLPQTANTRRGIYHRIDLTSVMICVHIKAVHFKSHTHGYITIFDVQISQINTVVNTPCGV